MGDVIAIFLPTNSFMKVDLPTFGLPINAINPDLKPIYSLTLKVQ